MKGIPLWSEDLGVTVLFFLSFSPRAVIVKGGLRQAGAFLLRPGEEILLRESG